MILKTPKGLCSIAARTSVALAAIVAQAAVIGCDDARSESLVVASGHGLNIEDPELVAYWDFNEVTGTALMDRSGEGNHGTVQGATWDPNGREGGCLYFNGTNSVVSVPDGTWNRGTPKTYNLWYKMDGPETNKYSFEGRRRRNTEPGRS